MYFNKMWQVNDTRSENVQSKHIFVGETRIATKINSATNNNTATERVRTYYYHSDHLGSAQTVTNWQGNIHERLEYTPYGETWIDWRNTGESSDKTPFRFTAKERDEETGLYYFGARYLDARTSRWLSVDPAMYEGDYLPGPGRDPSKLGGMGGLFNTINMHVYHYAANNPIKYIDPDGRMSANDHRSRTLKIAWDLGFSQRDAEVIADSNAAVDTGRTFPLLPFKRSQRPHFNTNNSIWFRIFRSSSGTENDSRHIMAREYMEKAVLFAENDMDYESLIMLGTGAHPVQDMPTHKDRFVMRILFWWSHWPFGMAADDPEKNIKGFAQADNDLREYLLEYIERANYQVEEREPNSPNPWGIE